MKTVKLFGKCHRSVRAIGECRPDYRHKIITHFFLLGTIVKIMDAHKSCPIICWRGAQLLAILSRCPPELSPMSLRSQGAPFMEALSDLCKIVIKRFENYDHLGFSLAVRALSQLCQDRQMARLVAQKTDWLQLARPMHEVISGSLGFYEQPEEKPKPPPIPRTKTSAPKFLGPVDERRWIDGSWTGNKGKFTFHDEKYEQPEFEETLDAFRSSVALLHVALEGLHRKLQVGLDLPPKQYKLPWKVRKPLKA